jgi:DNA repair exonuclease SbcCD ATPase subunit
VAEEPNYLAHAFKSQYNLIGLVTAAGFAVIGVSLLPLIVAAGVEMIVLPLVAGSQRFQRLVRARTTEEEEQTQQKKKELENSEMLEHMSEAECQRFYGLQGLAGEIRQNYKGFDESSRMLLDELVQKLDFLLSFYLRMRFSLQRYQRYFSTTDPERIQERIAMLDHEIGKGPERVKEIKARTRQVLEKRLERYQKALENRQLVEAQTETVEEVLQLLRDQSYAMRDPKTISEQLDGLVTSAEETERGVRDMEELLSMEQELLAPGALGSDVEAELGAMREMSGRTAARGSVPPVRLREAPPQSDQPPPRKKVTH